MSSDWWNKKSCYAILNKLPLPRINYDVLTCYLHILYKNNLLLPVIKGVLQSLYRHYQLQKIGTDGIAAKNITYTIVVRTPNVPSSSTINSVSSTCITNSRHCSVQLLIVRKYYH